MTIYTESVCTNIRETSDSAVVNGIGHMKANQLWHAGISIRKDPIKSVPSLQTERVWWLVLESSREHTSSVSRRLP